MPGPHLIGSNIEGESEVKCEGDDDGSDEKEEGNNHHTRNTISTKVENVVKDYKTLSPSSTL